MKSSQKVFVLAVAMAIPQENTRGNPLFVGNVRNGGWSLKANEMSCQACAMQSVIVMSQSLKKLKATGEAFSRLASLFASELQGSKLVDGALSPTHIILFLFCLYNLKVNKITI